MPRAILRGSPGIPRRRVVDCPQRLWRTSPYVSASSEAVAGYRLHSSAQLLESETISKGESMPTGEIQGKLWGARVHDWAALNEPSNVAYAEAIFDAVGVTTGTRLLDVGCATGYAAARAYERGAQVSGLDASEAMIAYARERVPQGDFRVGDLEALPFDDDSFDLVTGGNSFQYGGDPIAALREAKRVVRPGGSVAMVVWGRQEACQSGRILAAMGALLPPPPPGATGPFALSAPGVIEGMMVEAGLHPVASGDVLVTYDWPDTETAIRAFLAAGPSERVMQLAGEQATREAIRPALTSLLMETGNVRSANEFHYVLAHKAPASH